MKRLSPVLILLLLLLCIGTNANTINETTVQNSIRTGTLVAVGDISFSGISHFAINDPDYPWGDTKDLLTSASVLIGNQENPISSRGKIYTDKKWILRTDPRAIQALLNAGFDVVTLANNHMMDYGPLALEDTLNILDKANILHTGAGMNLNEARKPAIFITADGTKFAFLAYSLVYPEIFWASSSRPGTPYGDPNFFIPDIQRAKTMADFVVVSFHWSNELIVKPRDYQKAYGKKSIDAGATIVLGHHPHVLQGLEVYKGGLIAYSLGNFIFGNRSSKTKDSIVLAIDYDKSGLLQARLYPLNTNNLEVNFRTTRRRGADAERVLQDLRTYSKEFKTVIESNEGVGVIKIRTGE